MSVKQLDLAVILRATDYLSGPLAKIARGLEAVDRAARSPNLEKLSKTLDTMSTKLRNAGLAVGGAGLGMAHTLGLTDLPAQAVQTEHALRAIANTGSWTSAQLAGAGAKLREISAASNQMQPQMLGGLAALTAAGRTYDESMGMLGPASKAATATLANVEDLTRSLNAQMQNLKIGIGDSTRALEMMAAAGDAGEFELPDMGRFFPMLTGQAERLGMKGLGAVASLSSALQISRLVTGTSEEAANNLKNFLLKLSSPETQRNFAKLGINLQAEIAKALKSSDPLLAIGELFRKATGGDSFRLSGIIQDQEAGAFASVFMRNLEKYQKIRAEVAGQGSIGFIDRRHAAMMDTTAEQWKKLKIELGNLVLPQLGEWLETVNGWLKELNANPALRQGLLTTILGATAVGGGLVALAGVAKAISWVVDGLKLIGPAVRLAQSGFTLLSVAVRAFSGVLLTTPVGWIIAAIAAVIGALYLLYKHWGFVRGGWLGLLGAIRDGVQWVRSINLFDAGAKILRSLWDGMRSLALKPVEVIQDIAQKIRDHLPHSPAKVGPLRDLHRVRIVETIASSMQAGPMVRAMRVATVAAMAAAVPAMTLPAQGRPSTTPPSTGRAVQVTLHYAPQLSVGGRLDVEAEQRIEALFARERDRLFREFREYLEREERSSY